MNKYRLIFNGKSSADVGLFVGVNGNDGAPARVVEDIVIPGRNGTLTIDGGRYENVKLSYTCFLRERYDQAIEAARAFFLSEVGYKRLEDTAHPDEYRMAKVKSGLEVTPSQMREQGYFTVTFDAMPQRWLKNGELKITATGAMTLFNPTKYPSKPMLRVYGTGTVGVGDATLTVGGTQSYVDIDCERMDAYTGSTNMNGYVSGTFPVIEPGANGVTISGSVTSVEITPRWYVL